MPGHPDWTVDPVEEVTALALALAGAPPLKIAVAAPRARADPVLGVPADRGGRPRAARAQAVRGSWWRGGVEVHVVTRGGGRLSETEDRHGVAVHRVREPDFPKDDLDAFIAWVEHMNADMLAAALELDGSFDLVHSHDWLVADAARGLARRFGVPVAGDRARDRVRPPPGLGRQAPAVAHPRASRSGWCATPTA